MFHGDNGINCDEKNLTIICRNYRHIKIRNRYINVIKNAFMINKFLAKVNKITVSWRICWCVNTKKDKHACMLVLFYDGKIVD